MIELETNFINFYSDNEVIDASSCSGECNADDGTCGWGDCNGYL